MTTPRKLTVAIIGSGNLDESSPLAPLAEAMGRAIVDEGWRIICGGRAGVMLAAARGARSSRRHAPDSTVGILPVADPDVANPYIDVVIPTTLGHIRNAVVAQADAVVAIGGGAGTLTEIAFAWIADRPIIAFRVDGWSGKVADGPLDGRLRPVDFGREDAIWGVDDVHEAIATLRAVL